MDFFDVLSFLGGIALFLFGMKLLGGALETAAGDRLSALLTRFTVNKGTAYLLGAAVTALLQSSSATTVLVVGLVDTGTLTLRQSVGLTLGANLGTTITPWILSLNALRGDRLWVRLLQPNAFVPVLTAVGTAFYVFAKRPAKKNIGLILCGFSVLMFGMSRAAEAAAPLAESPQVKALFSAFAGPVPGLLLGAAVTGILQSSSVSVGILQALSTTGQLSLGAAAPIILGQNIGACVPTFAAAAGTGRDARRAAMVRLLFTLGAAGLNLGGLWVLNHSRFPPAAISATPVRIALCDTAANLLGAAVFLPLSGALERGAMRIVK